ncbi:subtilisin-like protease [Babesia ovata]|uniref:subtilisin n=1 Tax=Babesia ovata TaxID=189622 RepID=A0A2H6KCI9_9APIC|nr:subtilisin-like protease [Babesia ovata]GBE60716.1 subtilisin-like protease [Babesia ovata]
MLPFVSSLIAFLALVVTRHMAAVPSKRNAEIGILFNQPVTWPQRLPGYSDDTCGSACIPRNRTNYNVGPRPIRFVIRFPISMAAPSLLEIQSQLSSSSMQLSKGVDVVVLKNLNTYIIEPGLGNNDEDLKVLWDYLHQRGGVVEADKVATLSSPDSSAPLMAEPTQVNDQNADDTSTTSGPASMGQTTAEAEGNNGDDNEGRQYRFPPEQWYIDMLGVKQALHKLSTMQTEPIKVCIVDTGVNYQHEALKHAFDPYTVESVVKDARGNDTRATVDETYGVNFVNGTTDPMDHHGHGTNIAGVIAAKIDSRDLTYGVNPHARIIACKAFGDDRTGRLSDILKCIDYCITRKAHIQNHSWQIREDTYALRTAFVDAEEKGILMVVSAGNAAHGEPKAYNNQTEGIYPASYLSFATNLLAVAGFQKTGDRIMQRVLRGCRGSTGNPDECLVSKLQTYQMYDRSKYGPYISLIIAPAKEIYTTGLLNDIVVAEGSSIAAGIMSGISSLLISPIVNGKRIKPCKAPLFIQQEITTLNFAIRKAKWKGYTDAFKTLNAVIDHLNGVKKLPKLAPFVPQRCVEFEVPSTTEA